MLYTMKHLLISVVITTKNEERNIERLLKSLRDQSLPRKFWEVIMVDNASTDRTRQIAKKIIRSVYNLPSITGNKKIKNYRGVQLNFGIQKTHSPLIFFPDADMTFDSGLLEEIVDVLSNNNMDALYIPEVIVGKGFFGKVRNFERSFYNETSIDAVRCVKRSLYLKMGGFDEKSFRFGPDDWDFTMMLKKRTNKLSSTTNKLYHHEENLTLPQYLLKKWNYTATFDDYIKKWGPDHPDIKKQFSFYYRYIGVFVEHGKWMRLAIHPLLTLGMFFLRFSIGILYVARKFLKKR